MGKLSNWIVTVVSIINILSFANSASAESFPRRRITPKNSAYFKRISLLKSFNIQAVCYRPPSGQAVVGVIENGRFQPISSLSKNILKSSRFQSSLRIARKDCSKPVSTPTPTIVPTTLPAEPAPTLAPTPQPTQPILPTVAPILPTPGNNPPPTPTTAPQPTLPPATPLPTPSPAPTTHLKPVPQFARWQQEMLSYGQTHCETNKDLTRAYDPRLAGTYYDGELVYYKIFDYTQNPYWLTCTQAVEANYRDMYVVPNNGSVPGYWNFPLGLTQDYLRTGDQTSKNAVLMLSQNAAFTRESTQLSETQPCEASRETSYAIMTYLSTEDLGQPRRARLATLVNHALGHVDQWFGSKTCGFVKPFMVALTAHALIEYHSRTGDSRVLPALQLAAQEMWNTTWDNTTKSFLYIDRPYGAETPYTAPDLNLLIAPMYAWLFHQTGDILYRDRADLIFESGVINGYIAQPKQFNQAYRWTFEFMQWRTTPPLH